jgi:hypothetical protein
MKLNPLSLAVAAACSMIGGSALAVDVSSYNTSAAKIYISGATAQDVALLTSVVKFCDAGSLHRYSISNNAAFLCTAPGFSNGQLAVHKYSAGGSGNGVAPVNNGSNLPFLDLSKVKTNCAATGSTVKTLAGITYTDVACGGAASSLQTATKTFIGISDVEPAFFAGGLANAGNLASEALATVIFGVPVTRNVYEALQAKQMLNVGSVAEADMPSITTAQMTALYTVKGLDWSTLLDITPGATDQTIFVARRADSSGTQKTFEAVIARTINGEASTGAKSCQVSVDGFVATDGTANNNAATQCDGSKTVISGSGSGDVIACLQAHQDGNRGAVGVLTTETATSTVNTAGTKFFFLKVNGLAPSAANVTAGSYTYYGDASLNLPKSPLLDADHTTFVSKLKANFAITPVVHGFGNAGLMTIDAVTGSTGGNPWNRLVAGELNNCQQGRATY